MMTEERIMEYFIYENWVHKKAIIHKSSCSFCNDGKGFRKNTSDTYGRWLGPFKDKQEAKSIALNTKGKRIADCYYCLKSVVDFP